MRTTKIIAISVPPAFEKEISKHAKSEHKTLSEYIRETIRQYMNQSQWETTRKKVSKRLQKAGVKRSDIDEEIRKIRE